MGATLKCMRQTWDQFSYYRELPPDYRYFDIKLSIMSSGTPFQIGCLITGHSLWYQRGVYYKLYHTKLMTSACVPLKDSP